MDNLFKVCPVLDTRMERKISWKYVLSCTYMCLEVATWEWIYIYINILVFLEISSNSRKKNTSTSRYLDVYIYPWYRVLSEKSQHPLQESGKIVKNHYEEKSIMLKNHITRFPKNHSILRDNCNVVTYFNQISPKIITCLLLRKENFKIFPKIITICPFRKNCNSLKILTN